MPRTTQQRQKARTAERTESARKRVPLGRHKNIMTVAAQDKDPNYEYRWINDDDNRVKDALNAGYEVVNDPNVEVGDNGANRQNQSVGTGARKHVGKGMSAVLMRIKKEFYDEDQREKQGQINQSEKEMKRSSAAARHEDDEEHTYGGVKASGEVK